MLTLEITPGGRPRVVKIDVALLYLGVDINRPHHCPEMTPEELRLRKMARRRERRRRLQERREAKR